MITNSANHSPALALEKVPKAAIRMACPVSKVYKEIREGRLGPLVKLGARASAVPSASVDAWINARITETTQKTTSKKGGAV